MGTVRAALPYLKSLIETKGTEWYGSASALTLVERMQASLVSWETVVGERRLQQIDLLEWQLRQLRDDVVQSVATGQPWTQSGAYSMRDGDGHPLNDFVAGQLYRTKRLNELSFGAGTAVRGAGFVPAG
jgi:hypothetical protein